MSELGREIDKFYDSKKGKDMRDPLANILDLINESAGDVNYIVDDQDNKYTPSSLFTANQVYTIFADVKNSAIGATNSVYLSALPKNTAQRKMAMTSKRMYSELQTMDKILDYILGKGGT